MVRYPNSRFINQFLRARPPATQSQYAFESTGAKQLSFQPSHTPRQNYLKRPVTSSRRGKLWNGRTRREGCPRLLQRGIAIFRLDNCAGDSHSSQ
jgi:hypothetical protein